MQSVRSAISPRAGYIDLVRGFAIFLALFSHLMLAGGGWNLVEESSSTTYLAMRTLTRAATPTFIILFGASAEIAYVRRWRRDAEGTRFRLLQRSLQCYAALLALAVADVAGGGQTLRGAVAGALLLTGVNNGSIFAFYAVALLLMLVLVPLRIRLGLWTTLAIVASWWAVAWRFESTELGIGLLAYPVDRITGIGGTFGPSVLHAMPLVVVGMMLGRWAAASLAREDTTAARTSALVVAAGTLAFVMVLLSHLGVHGVADSYSDISVWREANHPAYFAIGTAICMTLLAGAWMVTQRLPHFGIKRPGPFSGASLLSFALGNLVINLLGERWQATSALSAVAISLGAVAAFWTVMKMGRDFRSARSSRPSSE